MSQVIKDTMRCTSMKLIFTYIVTLSLCWRLSEALIDQQPQQVHLSLGEDASSSITVTWVTQDELIESPMLEYGPVTSDSMTSFPFKVLGETTCLIDKGNESRIIYIHRVYLTGLKSQTRYHYHVGTSQGWSNIFTFTTLAQWPPPLHHHNQVNNVTYTVAVYGNLGNENAASLARLQQGVSRGEFDCIIHLGDIAIDLNDDNGRTGDQFMSQLEPIAGNIPYQVVVGDHETSNNYSHFNGRFTMVSASPSSSPNHHSHRSPVNNHYYSFNIGPVHFVAFSTEVYFAPDSSDMISNQYAWLKEDLGEANDNKNRHLRPWIIALGHRAMYTSINSTARQEESKELREDSKHDHRYSLEELLYSFNVDVYMSSHGCMYERMYPMYKGIMYNISSTNIYEDVEAPVHLTSSSGGSRDNETVYSSLHTNNNEEWSVRRIFDYGYTRLSIINGSHITFDQVSDDQDGKIVDSFTLVKYHETPFIERSKMKQEMEKRKKTMTRTTSVPLIRVNSSIASAHENKSNSSVSAARGIFSPPQSDSAFVREKKSQPLSKSITVAVATAAAAVDKTKGASKMDISLFSHKKNESTSNSSIS